MPLSPSVVSSPLAIGFLAAGRARLPIRRLVVLCALLALAIFFWRDPFRLIDRASLAWGELSRNEQREAIWLTDYQVDIEAKRITGLEQDVSALTYDPERQSLFTLTNKNPEIIELSLTGEIIRRIRVTGLLDPEAIEYVAPGVFVVADERNQHLVQIRIDAQTEHIDVREAPQMTVGIGSNGNKGFEGLAYDPTTERLYVAKEKKPMRIYEITGFPPSGTQPNTAIRIAENPARDAALIGRDLSSLHFDAATGHLLALSDESRLILELDRHGKPVSKLSLQRGAHGLTRGVPQAEGVTMDPAGKLYLVSEPNLFYTFTRR